MFTELLRKASITVLTIFIAVPQNIVFAQLATDPAKSINTATTDPFKDAGKTSPQAPTQNTTDDTKCIFPTAPVPAYNIFSPKVYLQAAKNLSPAELQQLNSAMQDIGEGTQYTVQKSRNGKQTTWSWTSASDPKMHYDLVRENIQLMDANGNVVTEKRWNFSTQKPISWAGVVSLGKNLSAADQASLLAAVNQAKAQGIVPVLIIEGANKVVQWKDKQNPNVSYYINFGPNGALSFSKQELLGGAYLKSMLLNADGSIKANVSVPAGLDLKGLLSDPNLVVTFTKTATGISFLLAKTSDPNTTWRIDRDPITGGFNVSQITRVNGAYLKSLLFNADGTLKPGVIVPAGFNLNALLSDSHLVITVIISATGISYHLTKTNDTQTSWQISRDPENPVLFIVSITKVEKISSIFIRSMLFNADGTLKEGVSIPAGLDLKALLADPSLVVSVAKTATGMAYSLSLPNQPNTTYRIDRDPLDPMILTVSKIMRITGGSITARQ